MFVKVKAGKELVRVKVTKVYANGEGEGEVYGNPQNPNLSGATRHYYGDTIRFRTKQGQPKMVRKIESEPEMTQHPVNMMQAVHSPYYSRLPNQRKARTNYEVDWQRTLNMGYPFSAPRREVKRWQNEWR